jgi:hypothetical protein
VALTGNPLSETSQTVHIPELERRGVKVLWEPSSFDSPEDAAELNPWLVFGPIVAVLLIVVVAFRLLRA